MEGKEGDMAKRFLSYEFDARTRMYGPYPEAMMIEVTNQADGKYASGIRTLGTMWEWKDRLGLMNDNKEGRDETNRR